MDVKNFNLFTVPVTVYNEFLPPALASEIKEYILNKKSKEARPHGAIIGDSLSIHNDLHNTNFITEVTSSLSSCSELHTNISKIINIYAQNNGIKEKVSISNSWFNIQNPGSFLRAHSHIGGVGSLISGALYINISSECAALQLHNPNPYNCLLEYTSNYSYSGFTIKPSIGDLILFPSWLMHSSDKINTTKNRIVISFNVNRIL